MGRGGRHVQPSLCIGRALEAAVQGHKKRTWTWGGEGGARRQGHDFRLGTGERTEARIRAGSVSTKNRPQIIRVLKGGPTQNKDVQALLLSPQRSEQPHTPEQSQARGQNPDVAGNSGRSLGVER